MKVTSKTNIVPILLSQQSAPVPITFSVKGKLNTNKMAVSEILGIQKYPVIIDIWMEGAVKKLSTYKLINQNIYFP